jgi:diamine N-acetyltransferase
MIVGKTVILRPLKTEDRAKYHEWMNNRDLVHLNTIYYPISDHNQQDWFDQVSRQRDSFIFSIQDSLEGTLVGSCSLRNVHERHRSAELQIRIGEVSAQGRGLGTEAVGLLTDFGFNDLNLNRVYLHVFQDNDRAIQTYTKCGFVQEGVLRENCFVNGSYKDVVVMGLLVGEYRGR